MQKAVLAIALLAVCLLGSSGPAQADEGDPSLLDGLYTVPQSSYYYRGREFFHAAVGFEIYLGRVAQDQPPLRYLGDNKWELRRVDCTPGSTRGTPFRETVTLVDGQLHYERNEWSCDPDSGFGSSSRKGIAQRRLNEVIDGWYQEYHPTRDTPVDLFFGHQPDGTYVVRTTRPKFRSDLTEFEVVELGFTTTARSTRTFEALARNPECPEHSLFRFKKYGTNSISVEFFIKIETCEQGRYVARSSYTRVSQ